MTRKNIKLRLNKETFPLVIIGKMIPKLLSLLEKETFY